MPARSGSGSAGHAAITAARSGSSGVVRAGSVVESPESAPHFAPPSDETPEFPEDFGGSSNPTGPLFVWPTDHSRCRPTQPHPHEDSVASPDHATDRDQNPWREMRNGLTRRSDCGTLTPLLWWCSVIEHGLVFRRLGPVGPSLEEEQSSHGRQAKQQDPRTRVFSFLEERCYSCLSILIGMFSYTISPPRIGPPSVVQISATWGLGRRMMSIFSSVSSRPLIIGTGHPRVSCPWSL